MQKSETAWLKELTWLISLVESESSSSELGAGLISLLKVCRKLLQQDKKFDPEQILVTLSVQVLVSVLLLLL